MGRKKLLFFMVVLCCGFSSCETKVEGCTDPTATNFNPKADNDDGTCVYPGENVFWTNADYNVGEIDVSVEGKSVGAITGYLATGLPKCGDEGFVTYKNVPGTYQYHAQSADGNWEWKGSITIEMNRCKTLLLFIESSKAKTLEIQVIGNQRRVQGVTLPLVPK